jgi:K+-sensing histidine kinase KdpD
MIGREEKRDRYEARMLVARERWTQFEDWGIALTGDTWEALKECWAWAQKRPLALRWTIVFVSVFLSIAIGLGLHSNVGSSSQLMLLLPAVLVSGLYGGMFAGTIAALLGAIATIHWKVHPAPGALGPDVIALTLYAVACAIVLGLSRAQEYQRAQTTKFSDTLEDKVRERTIDLETANRELMDFCYSISHDLRAPMRNIVGSSRILLDEAAAQLNVESRERLQGLANSANKLSEWVDDLLNYAKLGHTELKPEWVNITQMVDEIGTQLKESAWDYSSLSIRVHPNLVTTGDRVLIRMALRSILENSCKYAKKGKPLVIEVGEKISRAGTLITIRDNGIGFEQQYAKRIFEPFQRLHRESEYSGSGIGLANVKRIVDRHCGEIFAEAAPMVGTTIFLRFGSGKQSATILTPDSE